MTTARSASRTLVLFALGLQALACGDGSSNGGTGGIGGGATGGTPGVGGSTGGVGATGGSTGGVGATGGSTGGVGATGGSTGGVGATGGSTGGSSSGGAGATGAASGGTAGAGGSTAGTGGAGGTAGTGGAEATGGSGGGSEMPFALMSPSWDVVDNDDCTADAPATCPLYPQENVSAMLQGDNKSPEMSWPAGPEGTKSYAIVLADLSNGFTHWALWDLPATVTSLPSALPNMSPLADYGGAKQSGLQGAGYYGSGACHHVYEHHLYALSVETLTITGQANATGVRTAIENSGAILADSYVRLESRDYCN